MNFVYHMVPGNMSGHYLIPLNKMKNLDENLYAKYISKYDDHPEREFLVEREVPLLGCLWNDVVHFSTLHPHHIYRELKKLDLNLKDELHFYKIPIENLKDNENVLYHYDKKHYHGPEAPIAPENIGLLDVDDYEELDSLPMDTLKYFVEESKKDERIGMFHFVPHVLSKGKVTVEGAEIINWSEGIEDEQKPPE